MTGQPSESYRRKPAGGQGLVEFALVLPVLLLVLFAIFDLGRAVYAYSTIADAARTGSRVAIVDQDPSTDCAVIPLPAKCAAAEQAAGLGIVPSSVTVTYLNAFDLGPCTVIAVGSCVAEVSVPYTFNAATPIIRDIVGTIQMSSTTRLPVEAICSVAASCPPVYP